MNCYLHEDINSVVQCRKCNKNLCASCHDEELSDYCFVCALEKKNEQYKNDTEKVEVRERKSRDFTKFIAWYEMVGGIIGIFLLLIYGAFGGAFTNLASVGLISIVFILYSISIIAGVMLLKKKVYGRALSYFIQAVQIPQFLFKGVMFTFVSGAQFSLQSYHNLAITSFTFNFNVLSTFQFYVNIETTALLFAVNIIPIFLIYLLMRKTENTRSSNTTSA